VSDANENDLYSVGVLTNWWFALDEWRVGGVWISGKHSHRRSNVFWGCKILTLPKSNQIFHILPKFTQISPKFAQIVPKILS